MTGMSSDPVNDNTPAARTEMVLPIPAVARGSRRQDSHHSVPGRYSENPGTGELAGRDFYLFLGRVDDDCEPPV